MNHVFSCQIRFYYMRSLQVTATHGIAYRAECYLQITGLYAVAYLKALLRLPHRTLIRTRIFNPSQKSIQEYSKSLIHSHGLGFHWISLDLTGFDRISLVLYDVSRLGNSLVRYFWKTLEKAGQNETITILMDIVRSIFHWG